MWEAPRAAGQSSRRRQSILSLISDALIKKIEAESDSLFEKEFSLHTDFQD